MNIFKKAFCRSFQAVMRIMIPLFPYREPKLLEGNAGVAELLLSRGVKRAMLVTGPRIRKRGLTESLERVITEAGIDLTVFSDTEIDPTSSSVEAARALYMERGCEALIAFGGGSVMDCAKAVGARIARPKKPLAKMAGLIKICRRIPLLIAVPTTAGSGSETTVAAVIVDSETRRKYVINDFALIPRYVLLDPEVTTGLPAPLTATTGMDALTHAVEAYIGRSRTRGTKRAAEEAVRLIFDNLERAYANGEDIEARANMLRASYLAGTAFTKSYVGYVHAVAHTLGGRYGVAHGHANAVLLPTVLRAYGKSADKPLAELAFATGLAKPGESREVAAESVISRIEDMNARMNIPTSIPEIVDEDIPKLARTAASEANPLYPVPTLWSASELEAIYRLVSGK